MTKGLKKQVYTSCEVSVEEAKKVSGMIIKLFGKLYKQANVSKSEIQHITGTGTHTCFDVGRNFRLNTLLTLFQAAQHVCRIAINLKVLIAFIARCTANGTELIVYEAEPGKEPKKGEHVILKHLPQKKRS